MRKQIMVAVSVISITACILTGCGSNNNEVREAASAGEVPLETTVEAESEAETTTVQNAKLEEKTTKEDTTKEDTTTIESSATENTTKPSAEATIESTTSSTEVATTVYIQPQTEAPFKQQQTQVVVQATEVETTAYVEPQTEVQTPAPEPQTQAPTIKETEQVTQSPPEPPTEKETERQKTQEEYLEEFKANYMALRKEVCGDAPQWNETLYKIAKLRADEIEGYNFGHTSPNGYLNGYFTLENISQSPSYKAAWKGWNKSSAHYRNLCYAGMDIWAVAVGKGGCVFLSASSDDWCAEAYADGRTAENIEQAKRGAIEDYGATEDNWQQVLEEQVLWRICKDEEGNNRFDITWDVYIQEFWQKDFDWYTEQYGEKVVQIVE